MIPTHKEMFETMLGKNTEKGDYTQFINGESVLNQYNETRTVLRQEGERVWVLEESDNWYHVNCLSKIDEILTESEITKLRERIKLLESNINESSLNEEADEIRNRLIRANTDVISNFDFALQEHSIVPSISKESIVERVYNIFKSAINEESEDLSEEEKKQRVAKFAHRFVVNKQFPVWVWTYNTITDDIEFSQGNQKEKQYKEYSELNDVSIYGYVLKYDDIYFIVVESLPEKFLGDLAPLRSKIEQRLGKKILSIVDSGTNKIIESSTLIWDEKSSRERFAQVMKDINKSLNENKSIKSLSDKYGIGEEEILKMNESKKINEAPLSDEQIRNQGQEQSQPSGAQGNAVTPPIPGSTGGGGKPPSDKEQEGPSIDPKDVETIPDSGQEKESFGRKGVEDFYTLVTMYSDNGQIDDMQVFDAEDKQVWSAKENKLDITNTKELIRTAANTVGITSIDTNIVDKYLMPEPEVEKKEQTEDIEKETNNTIETSQEKPEVGPPATTVGESKTKESVEMNKIKENEDKNQEVTGEKEEGCSTPTLDILNKVDNKEFKEVTPENEENATAQVETPVGDVKAEVEVAVVKEEPKTEVETPEEENKDDIVEEGKIPTNPNEVDTEDGKYQAQLTEAEKNINRMNETVTMDFQSLLNETRKVMEG